MRAHPFVYLASQSPRRRQLLEQIGVAHELLLPEDDEDAEALEAVQPGEAAQAYVQRVTRLKLAAALQRLNRRGLPLAPVLCADTTVVLGRRILGKPQDPAEAMAMLQALSGRTHRVMTAVAVGWHPAALRSTEVASSQTRSAEGRVKRAPGRLEALSLSRVCFSPVPPQALRDYVQSGEPMGKAGAYGIQGAAAQWISHIEGSHSGIMGLPLHETAQLLRRVGALD